MRKKKILSSLYIILILSICYTPSIQLINSKNNTDFQELKINQTAPIVDDDYVQIPYLPADLDTIFWADNLTMQKYRLNEVGNGSAMWNLRPWGGCYVGSHYEGTDKWYLSPERYFTVNTPAAGRLADYQVRNGTKTTYNGSNLIADVCVAIDIGQKCAIRIDHLDILESLHNEFQQNNAYRFTKDQFLGFPHDWGTAGGTQGIDFYYYINYRSVFPLPAFPEDYQQRIIDYYSAIYEKTKLAGTYPESKMYYNLDKHIPGTLWGVWLYDTGSIDACIIPTDQDASEGYFLTLLSRDFTTAETFHKNPINVTQDLPASVVGLFCDGISSGCSDYDIKGWSLIDLVDGLEGGGILNLRTFTTGELGFNHTLYAKFSLDEPNLDNHMDDILYIEYFDTLLEAQGDFTENKLTYRRFQHEYYPWQHIIMRNIILVVVSGFIIIAAIITTITIVVIKRKKKKTQQ
ncbi:MAG: hypothetical protein FK733_02115 [Asgard group archaeon]|nr:hypothetical protein [Asgard group archaeon]